MVPFIVYRLFSLIHPLPYSVVMNRTRTEEQEGEICIMMLEIKRSFNGQVFFKFLGEVAEMSK